MLSVAHAPVIAATLPVVGEHLDAITGTFYDTMLADHPELLNVFSRSAQATGAQRSALAASIAAFATHLVGQDGPDAPPFDLIVDRIAHRHAALGIRPEQYTLVGRYLMDAIGSVLGAAVTPEIAAAWDEVYWLFAVRLVGAEARLYATAGVTAGRPWRPFTVVARREEAHDTVSLVLAPADGMATPTFLAGQYVSVLVPLRDGGQQMRQYSLSQASSSGALRITVRRVRGRGGAPDGLVSSHLHDHVRVGDQLTLSAPYGDLTLSAGTHPLVLISAGVGITPMAAILEHVARTQPQREVTAAHAESSPLRHPLQGDITSSGARLRTFRHLVWYEQPQGDGPAGAEVRTGLIEPEAIPLPSDAEAYLCGPLPFMRMVRSELRRRGLPSERIRYEVFGSDQWTASRSLSDHA
ncbi:FAD-binding oxidoreductase [Micromonospora sp. NPDC049274]|uniref:FAD-binding oxidoreductase n=1 Tax=Micromonospora sp. NPDC049274 TaxID=3154829 RepID=UPI00341A9B11